MKSKRSKATDITPKVRKIVLERDFRKCIYCGSHSNLTIAHYISRAHSGLGIPQNLVTLCIKCHQDLDNNKNKEVSDNIKLHVKTYLHFKYPSMKEKDLKYDKFSYLK